VTVRSGVVTLTGEVEDRHAKRLAEDLVEDTHGVREVTNQLRVRGRQGQQSQQAQGTASQQGRSLTDREVGRPAEREGAPGTASASGTAGSAGTGSSAAGASSASETRRGGTRGSGTRSEG
jgi:hypothetical protein